MKPIHSRPAPVDLLAVCLAAGFLGPALASAQQPDSATSAAADTAAADTLRHGDRAGPTADELASLLPAELPGGFERGEVRSGDQQGEPGARASYAGQGGDIRLTLGGVGSMRDRLVSMLEMQADRDEEVEETTYRGHRAFQGPMQGRRQVFVLVGEALAVRASTAGELPLERLRSALGALDWARVEELAGPAPDG